MIFPAIREAVGEFRQGLGTDLIRLGLNERQSPVGQGPNFPVSTVDNFLDWVSGEAHSWTGANVNVTTAMRVAVVNACIDRIASGVAQLPIITYRVREDDGKERAKGHYLYRRLRWQFNPLMTAYRGKHLMQTWVLQHGNAYAYLDLNERFQLSAIIPWHPKRTDVTIRGGEPWYAYRFDNGEKTEPVHWSLILHLRGLSTDGFFGLSPIQEHAQTIGSLMAKREHGARFFSNGARPLGVLEHPQPLSADAMKNIRESWNKAHQGLSNAHNIAILEEGMKYHSEGISMVDAQYVESQQFDIFEICRIFNVPPHMVQELSRSTNNNIEHQGLEWYQNSLGPWIVNWEQELTNSLLSDREAESIVVEFLMDSLMRADAAARAAYLSKAIGGPWMTTNEGRHVNNLNPLPGGDKLYPSAQAKLPGGSETEEAEPNTEEPDTEPQQNRSDAREMLVRHNGHGRN